MEPKEVLIQPPIAFPSLSLPSSKPLLSSNQRNNPLGTGLFEPSIRSEVVVVLPWICTPHRGPRIIAIAHRQSLVFPHQLPLSYDQGKESSDSGMTIKYCVGGMQ